jgi:membrane glycosyltransferase
MDGQLKTATPEDPEVVRGGMPFERPLPMPTQDLSRAPDAPPMESAGWRVILARFVSIVGTLAITGYGVYEMVAIVNYSHMTWLQAALIVIFAITLAWIAFSASSGIVGFFLPGPKFASAPLGQSRTALLMPVYNEDPSRTTAALQAMAESLAEIGAAQNFEIVVISDSTQVDPWIEESIAIDALRRELRDIMPVWYRRRWHNTGRKAGNVEEFVRRWGGRYDFMVVLDADSLMSGETLVELAKRMQADPRLGILQTVPMLVGNDSVFARLQQFAGRVYGAVIARGVSAWSGNDGN